MMLAAMDYRGKNVVVTGGAGFIGSNLALFLLEQGAAVTVVDSFEAGCGANRANLASAEGRIRVIEADIGAPEQFEDVLTSADVIFNLAGEISHVESMRQPERDLELNTVAQLRFLRGLARVRRNARVVYAGTRQIYGVPRELPVDESHPVDPVDFNGIHKYAATMYHLLMTKQGDLDAVVLRLTNVYGPRMALNVPGQGFLSAFLRRVLQGERLTVFGDGMQLRDPMFVDDAVRAFALAGATPQLSSRAYNVGGPGALTLHDVATMLSLTAGVAEHPRLEPFPAEYTRFDIGSYVTDWRRIRAELGWQPEVTFAEGVRRTIAWYRDKLEQYLQ
jgi:nucleoside-diphosphate-sugar epimerase